MNSQNSAENPPRALRGRPRDWQDKTEQNTIKSLDRAMQVFEYLSHASGKSLSALAAETGQSTATVYRILTTLELRGLVDFDPQEQVWHVGSQAFVIGSKFLRRTSLAERARPALRRLMEQTGETANLAVERSGQVLFLGQVETHETIRAFFPPGTLSAMHASGIGKVLLAQMSETQLAGWLSRHELEQFTRFTVRTAEGLHEELSAIRTKGFAIDAEERNLGMRCVAAPVFDYNGEAIAGISVSGPVSRMSDEVLEDLSSIVVESARALTNAIGGPGQPASQR
ncbi:MAG: HTH-type transcriptional regulator BhcR [Pseudomonadota bacterium]